MNQQTEEQHREKIKQQRVENNRAMDNIEIKSKRQRIQTYHEILEMLKYASTNDPEQTLKNQTRIIDMAFKAMIERAVYFDESGHFERAFTAQDLCRRTAATLQWMQNCKQNNLPHPLLDDKRTELEVSDAH